MKFCLFGSKQEVAKYESCSSMFAQKFCLCHLKPLGNMCYKCNSEGTKCCPEISYNSQEQKLYNYGCCATKKPNRCYCLCGLCCSVIPFCSPFVYTNRHDVWCDFICGPRPVNCRKSCYLLQDQCCGPTDYSSAPQEMEQSKKIFVTAPVKNVMLRL